MKHSENDVPARRPAALLLVLIGTMLGCLPVPGAEDGEADPARKVDLEVASKEIMKMHAAGPGNQARQDEKLAVSEYRIKGLWEEMGMQLFRLDHGGWRSSNFLGVDGQLKRVEIPTVGGVGLSEAVVHEKALYLTSEWGSGIARTALYRIRRDKEAKIQTEELGVISSVGGLFDKKFLEDKTVKKVMKLLQPLKRRKTGRVKR